MKRHLIAALMFGLALMAANGVSAGPFEVGNEAHQRGDIATAVKWYRLAAAQGHQMAQHYLGFFYRSGWSVPVDYVLAHMWYNLSGYHSQFYGPLGLQAQMTPSQIEKAQDMARKCLASNFKQCD